MQYVGRAFGSVSKTWNSINPATLSGAIDVIVVENEDGEMHCSPFHVRFGKFQLLRPSQKKVRVFFNGEATDIPMKLNDEGEAFFVFETDGYVPRHLQTSPVVSAESSPNQSPRMTPSSGDGTEMEYLDIGEGESDLSPSRRSRLTPVERAKSISLKLNIPSKVEANGDIYLDMHGYKSDKKDVLESDVLVKQLLEEEFGPDVDVNSMINKDMKGNIRILNADSTTNSDSATPSPIPSADNVDNFDSPKQTKTKETLQIPSPQSLGEELDNDDKKSLSSTSTSSPSSLPSSGNENSKDKEKDVHFKTLRLSSEQLKCLSLNYGENDITYSVNDGKSVLTCKLYLWKRRDPIVISDIDGTITKSDALGHVMTMLGRDWTHEGVAKLFADIEMNGYNIMYLTARSAGLADTTRSYLRGIEQDGYKLPAGPVILSPDRTIAALKREVVLKKPEVFKMACLNDIRSLYYPETNNPLEHDRYMLHDFDDVSEAFEEIPEDMKHDKIDSSNMSEGEESVYAESNITSDFSDLNTNTRSVKDLTERLKQTELDSKVDETNTPFYAGFGNRITDAISYRSVGIPSSRIFTINPDGDVKMELLEMAGFKCSYVSIVELVDQFFPPVDIDYEIEESDGKVRSNMILSMNNAKNKYTEFNYWRNPDIDLSLISDSDGDSEGLEETVASNKSLQGDEKSNDYDKNNEFNELKNRRTSTGTNGSTRSIDDEKNTEQDIGKDEKLKLKVNENEDGMRTIGSRLSFFMRSPLSSPLKSTKSTELSKYRGSSDDEDKSFDENWEARKDSLDIVDDKIFNEGLEGNEYDTDSVDHEESDSDYIYEASDEEEDDEEDEEEDGEEDGEEEEEDENEEDRIDEDSLYEKVIEQGSLSPSRNSVIEINNEKKSKSTLSGVSNESVNGKFV